MKTRYWWHTCPVRSVGRCTLTLFLSAALVFVYVYRAQAQEGPYTISGQVQDQLSRAPVASARITLLDAVAGDTLVANVATDARGRYSATTGAPVSTKDPSLPSRYRIGDVSPNPLTPGPVTLHYSTPGNRPETPSLELYDALGRRVDRARSLGSGVYFYRLRFEDGFVSPAKSLVLVGGGIVSFRLEQQQDVNGIAGGATKMGGGLRDVQFVVMKPGFEVMETTGSLTADEDNVNDFTLARSSSGKARLIVAATDTAGAPLPGVVVDVVDHALSGRTNTAGEVALDSVFTGVPITFRLSSEGYMEQFVRTEVHAGLAAISINAVLRPREPAVAVPNVERGATVTGRDGIRIELPPDAFLDSDQNAVTGSIDLSMTPLDVSDDADYRAFPGVLSGFLPDDSQVRLMTLGVYELLPQQGGQDIALAPGKTATIEVPLYANADADGTPLQEGDQVPLWSLDEGSGLWLHEAEGTVIASAASPTGLSLHGEISHFSIFNSDKYFEPAIARIRVPMDTTACGFLGGEWRKNLNLYDDFYCDFKSPVFYVFSGTEFDGEDSDDRLIRARSRPPSGPSWPGWLSWPGSESERVRMEDFFPSSDFPRPLSVTRKLHVCELTEEEFQWNRTREQNLTSRIKCIETLQDGTSMAIDATSARGKRASKKISSFGALEFEFFTYAPPNADVALELLSTPGFLPGDERLHVGHWREIIRGADGEEIVRIAELTYQPIESSRDVEEVTPPVALVRAADAVGDISTYHFTTAEVSFAFLDVCRIFGSQLKGRVRLRSPGGVGLDEQSFGSDCAIMRLALPETGTYTVHVSATANAPDGYSIQVEMAPLIELDTATDGDLEGEGDRDRFVFEANAGTLVNAAFGSSEIDEKVGFFFNELDNPRRRGFASNGFYETGLTEILDDGFHEVALVAEADLEGSYTLGLTGPAAAVPFTLDSTRIDLSGELSILGERSYHRFEGEAGDMINLVIDRTNLGARLSVLSPGQELDYFSAFKRTVATGDPDHLETGHFVLPESGSWLIEIASKDTAVPLERRTGSYGTTVFKPMVEPLVLDSTYAGAFEGPYAFDVYSITLEEERTIVVETTNVSGGFHYTELLDASGDRHARQLSLWEAGTSEIEETLPAGTYRVVHENDADGLHEYTMVVRLID